MLTFAKNIMFPWYKRQHIVETHYVLFCDENWTVSSESEQHDIKPYYTNQKMNWLMIIQHHKQFSDHDTSLCFFT